MTALQVRVLSETCRGVLRYNAAAGTFLWKCCRSAPEKGWYHELYARPLSVAAGDGIFNAFLTNGGVQT